MATVTLKTSVFRGNRFAVPLTKQWYAPAGCPTVVSFLPAASSDPNNSCRPPAYDEVWYNYGYYSPGICMRGYTAVFTTTDGILNEELLAQGETAAICVPTSWGYKTYTGIPPTGGGSINDPDKIIWATTAAISAPAFQIRWKSSDLTLLEVPPITGPVIASTASTIKPATESSSSDTSQSVITQTTEQGQTTATGSSANSTVTAAVAGSGSAGLQGGTIAAIAVGVVAFFAIAVAAVMFVKLRRRRSLNAVTAPPPHYGPSELHAEGTKYSGGRVFVNQVAPHPAIELGTQPAATMISELPGSGFSPSELPASHPSHR